MDYLNKLIGLVLPYRRRILSFLLGVAIAAVYFQVPHWLDQLAVSRVQARNLVEKESVVDYVPVITQDGFDDRLTKIEQKLDQLKP